MSTEQPSQGAALAEWFDDTSASEEVRLLLVDAYMVQGDYDRAMSLLHEPAG